MNRADAAQGYQDVFRRSPTLVARAPGRVNLIGEHTDYNDGFVMPAAIGFATWTAAGPRSDRRLVVHAGNHGDQVSIDLDHPGPPRQHHWSDYVRGIAAELEADGHPLVGADLWFAGDVPVGAGLSSSAALETSVGLSLLSLAGVSVDPARLAKAGQRAEHHYAGTQCGIMDQFISAHGRRGHALMLDCRTLEHRLFPIPDSLRIVVLDTGVKHQLAGGEYNTRRAQCEEGVAYLRNFLPSIRALRDVTASEFSKYAGGLSEVVFRRCRHVIGENTRVHRFAEALEARDAESIAASMGASHVSLRDDYEVSCDELDALVEAAYAAPGAVGSRMTGGGFGGCTVNLVEAPRVDAFVDYVSGVYAKATGRPPKAYVTEAADGAAVVPAES